MNLLNPSGILRIEAPFYVAASIWERGRCVEAAPILHWMIGKRWVSIHRWLFGKGYAWQWVKEHDLTEEMKGQLNGDGQDD